MKAFINTTSGIVIGTMLAFASTTSSAAAITFSDQSAFLTATGATSATGPLSAISSIFGSHTIGTVTITAPKWGIGNSGFPHPGNWIGVSQGNGITPPYADGIDLAFALPVYAAGFQFFEPSITGPTGCNDNPCIDSTFLVTGYDAGNVQLFSFSFNAPNDVLAFVGVQSSDAFKYLRIYESVGGDENELYGQIYTSVVPVPAAVWLFGSALGLMGVMRRKINS
jgi:hypothetical protein